MEECWISRRRRSWYTGGSGPSGKPGKRGQTANSDRKTLITLPAISMNTVLVCAALVLKTIWMVFLTAADGSLSAVDCCALFRLSPRPWSLPCKKQGWPFLV